MAGLFLRYLTVGGTVTVLLLPLLLGHRWLEGRYSAQTRWILWLSLAGVLLIAPLLPQRAAPVQVEVPAYTLPLERTVQTPQVSVPVGNDPQWEERPGTVDGEKVPAHTDVGTVTEVPQVAPVSRRVDWTELAAAVWLGVAALLLAGEGLRYLLVRWRLMKLSRPMAGEREGSPLRALAGLGSPVTVGFCRPVVFLPSEETDPMALCHELTHIKRRDTWGKALLFLACALYWFHPLVWLMARRADRDVEAACDAQMAEGLSLTERRAYGALLLASAGEAGALPFATRFGGSKEQMKARLTQLFRPGKRSRTLVCVLLLAALLLSGLVACRPAEEGAGPDGTETPAPSAGASDGVEDLTAEELEWFQEEFFRSGADNIRNVFGRPGERYAYASPRDIDLYWLFYDGPCLGERVTATEEELRAAYPDLKPEMITCPAYRVTRAEMNEVLLKYTGLTLEETNQVELYSLPYLEEWDAWYWMHGDNNYPGPLTLLRGEREGSNVRLYQRAGDVLYCLTLEQQGEGEYWFVSNLPVAELPPEPPSSAGLEFSIVIGDQLLTLGEQSGEFPWGTDLEADSEVYWNMDGFYSFAIDCGEGLQLAGLRREKSVETTENGSLTGFDNRKPDYKTYRGAYIGMSLEEFQALYPEAYLMSSAPEVIYAYNDEPNCGFKILCFVFEDDLLVRFYANNGVDGWNLQSPIDPLIWTY